VALVPAATVLAPAQAATTDAGNYSAQGRATAVHATVLDAGGLGQLVDARLATASGSVDSSASTKSKATGRNVEATLLGQSLPADALGAATQTAPPDNADPASKTTVAVPDNPLLSLGVATSTAHARWLDEDCLAAGQPVEKATATTADAGVLDVPGVGAVIGLDGEVSTRQATTLVGNGATRAVQSQASGDLATVNLGGGQLVIEVLTKPTLTATASGTPGGATVDYTPAQVVVHAGGQEFPVPADGTAIPDLPLPDDSPFVFEIASGQLTKSTAADGTSASGSAATLHVEIGLRAALPGLSEIPGLSDALDQLGPLGDALNDLPLLGDLLDGALGGLLGGGGAAADPVTLAQLDLFPLQASATAPEGGVVCGAGGPFDLTRIAGSNRYGTATDIAQEYAASGDAIIVNGAPGEYADALSADYLAGVKDLPVLLVRHDKVPGAVLDELERRDARHVYIVGGDAAVSDGVESQLEGAGYEVTRVEGPDRFATSAEVIEAGGPAADGLGIVATGMDFPDALAAAPLAYSETLPLGLSRTNRIDDEVVDAFQAAGVDRVLVMGGEAAVGPGVVSTLAANGITIEERLDGSDRAETSTKAATYAVEHFGFTDTAVDIASGYEDGTGADALAGGPLAGEQKRPVLITRRVNVPGDAVIGYLSGNADTLAEGSIFGGTAAVSTLAEILMESTVNSAKEAG
jgi:putative cell wall-binding protein